MEFLIGMIGSQSNHIDLLYVYLLVRFWIQPLYRATVIIGHILGLKQRGVIDVIYKCITVRIRIEVITIVVSLPVAAVILIGTVLDMLLWRWMWLSVTTFLCPMDPDLLPLLVNPEYK